LTHRWLERPAGDSQRQAQSAESSFGWSAPTDAPPALGPETQPADTGEAAHAPSQQSPPDQTSSNSEPTHPDSGPVHSDRKRPLRITRGIPDPRNTPHEPLPAPEWPGSMRSGKDPVYQRLPHLAIIAIAIAMVLGGGFWSRDQEQSTVMPGGTDNIQFVSSDPFTEAEEEQEPVPNTRGLIASAQEDLMGGYLSTASLSVTPQQLGVETYVTQHGQTISSVALDTGRSEETLLWANDYRDPDQTLAPGTQLRIPPVDGMLHLVTEADTLENIAERYDVSTDVITSYEPNGVEHSADLVPNRLIMVPGGSMPKRNEVMFYTVREGDQLWQVAERFDLRAETLLWTNSLSSSEDIEPGQQLAILPTDGIIVEVGSQDTVDSLAEEYDASESAIRDWPANGLGDDGTLMVGQSLMIPGGVPPEEPEPEPIPEPTPTPEIDDADDADEMMFAEDDDDGEVDDFYTEPADAPEPEFTEPSDASPYGTGEFITPTTGVITQYFHSAHNGWDIANLEGTEIWAADNGRVIFSGWNEHGLGYAVAIDHGNGYQTWYGHMKEHPPVEVGQAVGQGEYIGPMGSTGFSTGPHVHFVIAYNGAYQDPGSYLR
jgi:murein DD-endopeptidase MepM/ murein hydrolase activator NlpD